MKDDVMESAVELLRVIDALREVNVLGEWPVVRAALQPLRDAITARADAEADNNRCGTTGMW